MLSEGVLIEDQDEGIYCTYHDMTSPDLSVTITQALAEVKDTPVTEAIDRFSKYVDPDALDQLFMLRSDGPPRHEGGYLHLEIDGISVTVHADGEIVLVP